jgi:hypothetical protein
MATPSSRWGAYTIAAHLHPDYSWFDFHTIHVPWLGFYSLVLGKLSIDMTYPVYLGS